MKTKAEIEARLAELIAAKARAALGECAVSSTERWTKEEIAQAKVEVKELYDHFHPPVSSTVQVPPVACPGGIDPGFDECPKCGATITETCAHSSTNHRLEEKLICRNCGGPIDDDDETFCGMCREMGCTMSLQDRGGSNG